MQEFAGENKILYISSFPKLGDKRESSYFIQPVDKNINDQSEKEYLSKISEISENPYSQSNYVNDNIINSHPRFATLTQNIRKRRGKKVDIRIPIFKDLNTNLTTPTEDEPYPGFIHMDAMAFGMGSCSLQVTIGSCRVNSASLLYDQFIPLAPILLALSSSGPIFKGKLSGFDNRFNIISQAVDDRTDEEKDPYSPKYIYKSTWTCKH